MGEVQRRRRSGQTLRHRVKLDGRKDTQIRWSWVEWVFSGIGVAVLGFLGFIVRKFFERKGDSAVISASRSSVVGSPVASGSNISQTVNFTTVTPPDAILSARQERLFGETYSC